MPDPWAISGVDLHLDLAGSGVRAGLETALRDAVRSGRLAAGTRLPSSRSLAQDLGIARNTVADVYGQLVAEGWLSARTGSGTRVADRAAADLLDRARPAPVALPYDLRPGWPDLSAFPRGAWAAAARRALLAAPSEALGYSGSQGRPELREALAGYLARTRGVHAGPDRVVICSGFMQAMGLLCRVLAQQGRTDLAVEAFGHPAYREVARANGVQPRPVAVDGSGAVIDQLGEADAVLLTPAHQFPLGVVLSARRRAAVAEWAERGGRLVIEDDYDGEFRYDRQPVGALAPSAPQCVAYAGTASKTLIPGLRLAWLVLPDHLVEPVVEAKSLADRLSNTLDQLTLAEFIHSGAYDRHIRRSRIAYRRRRDRLVRYLADADAPVRVTGVAAGLHALVELPADWSEAQLIEDGHRRGLALEGLQSYQAAEPRGPALVIGYATPAEHAFTGAVGRLLAVLDR